MKRFLLSFITAFALIPCLAQQSERPESGCGNMQIPVFVWEGPVSQIICPGSNASFTSSATNVMNRTWQMSTDSGQTWVPAIGQLHAAIDENTHTFYDTLIIPAVYQEMNGYFFRCTYYSICNSTAYLSAVATLTVAAINPQIISQPQNISVCKSFAADFTVAATGSSPNYQWQQSIDGGNTFTNLPGKTNSILTVDSVTLSMNNYQYRCLAGSPCASSVTSSAAVLTVKNESTDILIQPASQNLCSSDSTILNVVATGNNLSYQWQDYYTVNIAGATDATLRLPYQNGYHTYRCKIESTCKTIYSNPAVINYTILPELIPVQVKYLCNGEEDYFAAINNEAASQPTLQWQVSTDSGMTFTNIPNENHANLIVTSSAGVHGNRYRCSIINDCFNGFSNVHTLYNSRIDAAFATHPQNTEVCAGSPAVFNADANNDIYQYNYLWEVSINNGVNFTHVTGVFGHNLTLSGVTVSMNNYQYRCKVLGCGDTAYSHPAVLNVKPGPSLGNDNIVNIACDTCTADIAALYNTSGFSNVYWGTAQPEAAKPGKHQLKVFTSNGCGDSAFIYVNVIDADTIRACDGAALRIVCNIPGTTYQWEWDHYGPGSFNSMSDQLSITNGPVLFIQGISLSGRLIRCRVDGNLFTNVIYVKPTAYWNGSVDNNWNNPLNWSCGKVPLSNMEVIIAEGARFIPYINVDASCKKLYIRKNAQLITTPGTNLKIGMNW